VQGGEVMDSYQVMLFKRVHRRFWQLDMESTAYIQRTEWLPFAPSPGLWLSDEGLDEEIKSLYYNIAMVRFDAYTQDDDEKSSVFTKEQAQEKMDGIIRKYIGEGWELSKCKEEKQ
jgi:hypothetical protein